MFESVEQLEKEVDAFHKNILASTELVKGIEEIIATTKAQKDEYAAASSALLLKLDSDAKKLNKSNEEALAKLNKENSSVIEAFKTNSDDLLNRIAEVPDSIEKKNETLLNSIKQCTEDLKSSSNKVIAQLKTDNANIIDEAVKSINAEQKAYLEKLEATDKSIQKCEAELSSKYNEFLIKLQSTNIDQIFKTCQDLKKSVNTKLTLLSVGIGISIALMIVSFFVK